MLIGFDASRAFVGEVTGTENYSLNLLRALAKVDRKNRYRVYLREAPGSATVKNRSAQLVLKENLGIPLRLGLRQRRDSVSSRKENSGWLRHIFDRRQARVPGWPGNFEFKVIRPNRLWTQLSLAYETWRNPVDLLFIPAHTLPVLRRRKIGKLKIPNCKSQTNSKIWSLLLGVWNFFAKQTKCVVTIHDLGVEYLPTYHQFPQKYYLDWASKYAAAHADALIAVSKATKRDLIKRYGVRADKVFVVPEGVDASFFRPVPKQEIKNVKIKYKIDGNYVLFVGTVQPRKNLEMLIQAFARLVKEISTGPVGGSSRPTSSTTASSDLIKMRTGGLRALDGTPSAPATRTIKDSSLITNHLSLVIAGKLGWAYQEILDAPEKLGIGKRVKFLNYVDRADLPALYSGAALCVFPSLFEGFDLPILEALACGCRVVASDIGPHREIMIKLQIPNSKSNNQKLEIGNWKLEIPTPEGVVVPMILVKPKDIIKWTDILYQYISQYYIRADYSNKTRQNWPQARKILTCEFNWELVALKTLAVFNTVCAAK